MIDFIPHRSLIESKNFQVLMVLEIRKGVIEGFIWDLGEEHRGKPLSEKGEQFVKEMIALFLEKGKKRYERALSAVINPDDVLNLLSLDFVDFCDEMKKCAGILEEVNKKMLEDHQEEIFDILDRTIFSKASGKG